MVTGIELRDCFNVAISCAGLHPVRVRLEAGEDARLFVVPREVATRRVDFIWNFAAMTVEIDGVR